MKCNNVRILDVILQLLLLLLLSCQFNVPSTGAVQVNCRCIASLNDPTFNIIVAITVTILDFLPSSKLLTECLLCDVAIQLAFWDLKWIDHFAVVHYRPYLSTAVSTI